MKTTLIATFLAFALAALANTNSPPATTNSPPASTNFVFKLTIYPHVVTNK